MADLVAGWGWPGRSRKAHYFREGDQVSVCGKWMFIGDRDPDPRPSPDDCAACRKWVTTHG